jgi:hypothetical protein
MKFHPLLFLMDSLAARLLTIGSSNIVKDYTLRLDEQMQTVQSSIA